MTNLFLIRDPLKFIAGEYMNTYTKLNTIQSGLVDNLEMNKTDLNILKKYMDLCNLKIKNEVELLTLNIYDLKYSDMRFDRLTKMQFDKKNRTIYIIGSVINREKNYYLTDISINSPQITLFMVSKKESLPITITFCIKNYYQDKNEIKNFFGVNIDLNNDMIYYKDKLFRNVEIMGGTISNRFP